MGKYKHLNCKDKGMTSKIVNNLWFKIQNFGIIGDEHVELYFL